MRSRISRALRVIKAILRKAWLMMIRRNRSEEYYADQPFISLSEDGIIIFFHRGQWRNAFIFVNDRYSCKIDIIGAGETLFRWSKFQVDGELQLSRNTVHEVVISGYIDGHKKTLEFQVGVVGEHGSFASSVSDEE